LITSHFSRKEPALLPQRHSSSWGGTQTRHERAAGIEPTDSHDLKNVFEPLQRRGPDFLKTHA